MMYLKNKLLILVIILSSLYPQYLFADDIGYSTVGSSSNTIGSVSSTNVYGSKYTSTTGGTMATAYINGHNNWNGTDTVLVLIYNDTGGYPYMLIAESDPIAISASTYQWWSAPISGSITASTDYWIFVRNITVASGSVRIHNDANTITGFRTADPNPTNNPFANGAITNNNSEYSIYISYTAGEGEPSLFPNRRRKIINNLYGETNEEDIVYASIPAHSR